MTPNEFKEELADLYARFYGNSSSANNGEILTNIRCLTPKELLDITPIKDDKYYPMRNT